MSSIKPSNTRVSEWSYDHFVAYLMLYASYADYDYSQKEKENILSLVDKDILSEVEVEYERLGDYAQLDLIMQLKKQFVKTKEDKSKILQLLNTQFSADGDYSRLETGLYTFLEKLL